MPVNASDVSLISVLHSGYFYNRHSDSYTWVSATNLLSFRLDHYLDAYHNSLLHIAVQKRSLSIVAALMCSDNKFVSQGCCLSATNLSGDTPLHAAIIYRKKEPLVMFNLLRLGKDTNAGLSVKNASGLTVLELAMREKKTYPIADIILEYCFEHASDNNEERLRILSQACQYGRFVKFKSFINIILTQVAAHTLSHVVDHANRETLLHIAARSGNIDIVRYLLDSQEIGFELMAPNSQNKVPAEIAIENGNFYAAFLMLNLYTHHPAHLAHSEEIHNVSSFIKRLNQKTTLHKEGFFNPVINRGFSREKRMHAATKLLCSYFYPEHIILRRQEVRCLECSKLLHQHSRGEDEIVVQSSL